MRRPCFVGVFCSSSRKRSGFCAAFLGQNCSRNARGGLGVLPHGTALKSEPKPVAHVRWTSLDLHGGAGLFRLKSGGANCSTEIGAQLHQQLPGAQRIYPCCHIDQRIESDQSVLDAQPHHLQFGAVEPITLTSICLLPGTPETAGMWTHRGVSATLP